jgi:hypothetical protein
MRSNATAKAQRTQRKTQRIHLPAGPPIEGSVELVSALARLFVTAVFFASSFVSLLLCGRIRDQFRARWNTGRCDSE